jgi:hypothetical protein
MADGLSQLAYPDVAVPYRAFVVLEVQGHLRRMRGIGRPIPSCVALDFHVILNQDSVVQDRHECRFQKFPPRIEPRGFEDDVVRLPLAGLAGSIHQRGVLAVNSPGHAVREKPGTLTSFLEAKGMDCTPTVRQKKQGQNK